MMRGWSAFGKRFGREAGKNQGGENQKSPDDTVQLNLLASQSPGEKAGKDRLEGEYQRDPQRGRNLLRQKLYDKGGHGREEGQKYGDMQRRGGGDAEGKFECRGARYTQQADYQELLAGKADRIDPLFHVFVGQKQVEGIGHGGDKSEEVADIDFFETAGKNP